MLDGKPVKTPLKTLFKLPNRKLAEALAEEWNRQGEHINMAVMFLTKLTNIALDRATNERKTLIGEMVNYLNADLVCYRDDTKQDLLAREQQVLDPWLKWAGARFEVRLEKATGPIAKSQPEAAAVKLRQILAGLDCYHLAAGYNLVSLLGSAILTLALMEKQSTDDDVWIAAHIEEDWQIEQWGEDHEASERRARYRREYDQTMVFLKLL